MIETILYMAIGFLLASLVGLIMDPLVYVRTVCLTHRRLEAVLPRTRAEIQTVKDLLRAQFAMSMRRLEMNIERVKKMNAILSLQLCKRNESINHLRIGNDALKVEVIELKMEVEALKKRAAPTGKRPKTQV